MTSASSFSSSSSSSSASIGRCYVPRSVIVAVVAALASCTDAATVMTRMKDAGMFKAKGAVDVDGNAAASAMKDNSEAYNFNSQNYTNVGNITDADDDDGTSGPVSDEEQLSAVWYLAAFGGLVLFFFVVTLSELFFANPIYTRETSYLRRVPRPYRKPQTPPPPYHLFAPPSYEDTIKGGFGQVQQQYHQRVPGASTGKKLADVYVVPVHAPTTAAGTTCYATCTANLTASVADAKLLAAVLPPPEFK